MVRGGGAANPCNCDHFQTLGSFFFPSLARVTRQLLMDIYGQLPPMRSSCLIEFSSPAIDFSRSLARKAWLLSALAAGLRAAAEGEILSRARTQ